MQTNANSNWRSATSVYDFSVTTLDGDELSLDKFRGKVLLIVNIASNCAFTKQIPQLNELHNKYAPNLQILGFPCNQFGQEPKCNTDLKEFIEKKHIEWHVFAKVNVNGDDSLPLYKYLKHKMGGTLVKTIKWNFTKFLCSSDGQPVARYGPNTSPLEIEDEIKAQLKI